MPDISKSEEKKPTVCIVALPESSSAVLYGLNEVLSTFGKAWSVLTGEDQEGSSFDVKIVARSRDPLSLWGGALVVPQATMSEIDRADVVIVTDLVLDPGLDCRGKWADLVPWFRQMQDGGAMICSVCSGSLLLASLGLLDGKAATTHWGFVDHFREFFPAVTLQPDRVLVAAGPENNLVTTGGMSAWEDLALYLIARFHGEATAIKAAKLFLFGDRSEGQLLYAARLRPKRHYDAVIEEVQSWIAEHYHLENAVACMVSQSGLKERTFKRRFKSATGYTPIEYVQTLRIEEAKQLLETTGMAIDTIAERVGYSDPTSFRRLFKRTAGVTPGLYRRRYRAITRSLA